MSRALFPTLIALALLACSGSSPPDEGEPVESTVALLESAFLDADWYIQETMTDVPHGAVRGFAGLTSKLEKVRWEINDEYLVAYRGYEVSPGSDPDASDPGWHEEPVAMYPILERIKGGPNKPFTEDAMRIDWRNVIDGVLWYGVPLMEGTAFTVRKRDDTDAFEVGHFDPAASPPSLDPNSYEDGSLYYVDFTNRSIIEALSSSPWDCREAQDIGDSASTFDPNAYEVAVRTALLRVPRESEYEPVVYDTIDQNKFGYFRSARQSIDPYLGQRLTGLVHMANRQNIWRDTWERDADGRAILDDAGERIARPFAERSPRPLVYYLSAGFPEHLKPSAEAAVSQWDRALRRAVATAQQVDAESVPGMFILCENPVAASDDAACGPVGTHVEAGDLRYRRVTVVANPQTCGPLGYGPSGPDPETGEIIFSDAVVYESALNSYAHRALELVRFINGDLDIEELQDAADIRAELEARLEGTQLEGLPADVIARSDDLVPGAALDASSALSVSALFEGPVFDDSGITEHEQRLEILDTPATAGPSAHDDDSSETRVDLQAWVSALRTPPIDPGDGCYLRQDMQDSLIGIARKYVGRTDYDQIRLELLGLITQSVIAHEVGHTLGLRHNFAASADYVNYGDPYWELKSTGVYGIDPSTGAPAIVPLTHPIRYLNDIHLLSEQTPAQALGGMREHAYSSVMDYGARFNSDSHGIGKYDEAAILYGYTTGGDRADDGATESRGKRRGYVEVFEDAGGATGLLRYFSQATAAEDRRLVEGVHYHTFLRYLASTGVDFLSGDPADPGPDAEQRIDQRLSSRGVARFDEVASMGAVEVPYLFYPDEFAHAKGVAMPFDAGADPFEQARDHLERYRDYYPFLYFGRDRADLDPFDVSLYVAVRYLIPFQIYFDRFYLSLSRPPLDPVLQTTQELAGIASLNALGEAAAMTPSYGSYVASDARYELTSLDADPNADLYVPPGPGRRWESKVANVPNDATFVPYQYTEVGHELTARLALQTLAGVIPTVYLEEEGGFSRTARSSMALFPDRITALFNALYLQDSSVIGPRVVETPEGLSLERPPLVAYQAGAGVFVDPETLRRTVPPVDDDLAAPLLPHLDVARGGQQKRNAGFTAMALLLTPGISGVGLDYQEQARVFQVGSDEQVEPGPGFETVVYCDTLESGLCYGAIAATETTDPGLGARLVLRAQALHAAAEAGNSRAALELEATVQDMDYLRGLYDAFGSL